MKGLLAVLALLVLVGCSTMPHGSYVWRHPDGTYDKNQLWKDIDECEEYRKTIEDKSPYSQMAAARDFGGWGNMNFDLCMNQRNWYLKYEPIAPNGNVRP